ncbi:MAG: heme exporter protein CcmB [Dehalococcoidia bacterium]|nr:heme exporter protein CcmB [Chloroflexota bacterium]MCZ6866656.1 heme exporter protein CcmB [Chloroflexota bacterium]
MKEFLRPVFLVTWKDILLELRSREVVIASMVFAVMVVVIFNFALNVTPETVDILAPGILWVAFAFAGVLAMSRAFVIEKDQGSLEGLLLCPVSRDSLYFGKMLALFLFMTVVEAVLLPIFAVLFDFSAFSFTLIGVILLATLGFATVGTLFSSIAVNTRSREIMLPVLFFPVITPVIIGAVETSTGAIGSSVNVIGVGRWLQLIAVFDAVFLVLCPWAFGLVMEE